MYYSCIAHNILFFLFLKSFYKTYEMSYNENMSENYFVDRDNRNIKHISAYLEELPDFCYKYFLEMENYTSTLSRLNYAMDLKIFFDFLARFKFSIDVKDLTLAHIEKVTADDISSFLSYLSFYTYKGKNYKNNERGKARKLSSIRSLFKYLFNKDKISSNVASKITMPKQHEKDILRLEVDEVSRLVNQAESPSGLTKQQQGYNKHTRERDVAILTLFLATGIRVSELVGLNVEDFDFDNHSFKVTRKGGNQAILYFSQEVEDAIKAWLLVRDSNKKLDEKEKALFISLQNKRICVRAVEQLVKKYAGVVTPLKKITPHKLRSTYGTNLYRETGDIYIVADVLGHRDVNTTRKHYAAITEDKRRSVADKIKVRF